MKIVGCDLHTRYQQIALIRRRQVLGIGICAY
jgi:hypothetical protein